MSVEGIATVERENIGELDAYEGMALQSGDQVKLQGNSKMVLTLDDDKYAFVEENTEFYLYATGTSESSKTAFDIKTGAVTCQCMNKLSDDSEYYINTPNSTMAIRGTVVRVSVSEIIDSEYSSIEFINLANEKDELQKAKTDTNTVTRLSTIEGTAEVGLHNEIISPDKSDYLSSLSKVFKGSDCMQIEAGKEVVVGTKNSGESYYITDVSDIDKKSLPDQTLVSIDEAYKNDSGKTFALDTKDIEELLEEGQHTVTFMYNGKIFGTQTVAHGQTPSVPGLVPAQAGGWSVDFSTPVNEDVTIIWK